MSRRSCNDGSQGMVFGVLILTIGVLFLLRNLNVVYFDSIWQFWPLGMLIPGILRLLRVDDPWQDFGGLALTGVGGVWLLSNLNVVPDNVWDWLWPLLLIGGGAFLLLRRVDGGGWDGTSPPPYQDSGRRGTSSDAGQDGWTDSFGRMPPKQNLAPQSRDQQTEDTGRSARSQGNVSESRNPEEWESPGEQQDYEDDWFGPNDYDPSSATRELKIDVIFGGIDRRITTDRFEGGKLAAVFGGLDLDLRDAQTQLDQIVLHADAVFGGIDVMVPDTWEVDVQGTGVFGAYDDQTHPPVAPADGSAPPLLIVKGGAVFGGVTIRN